MKAVVVRRHGGPEVLEVADIPDPVPRHDEALVEIAVAGVNYIDIYHRSGAFALDPPLIPGSEATGTVTAVGEDVDDELIGRRVAFVTYPVLQGTYAQQVRVPAWRLVPVPKSLPDTLAGCSLMAGMTAHYLTHDVLALDRDDWAVVHAAAGGVGSLLVQYLSRRGVRVIAAVSTPEKAGVAIADGAEVTVLTSDERWSEKVTQATAGEGVRVVFDSVGRATFDGSLACLRRRGWLVLFGISSGPPRDLAPEELLHRGSLVITRPGLVDFTATSAELQNRAAGVLSDVSNGRLNIRVEGVLPLSSAPEAHRRLESRQTTGKLLLSLQD